MQTVIIGSGGHAKVVIDTYLQVYPRASLIGVVTNDSSLIGHDIFGVPVIGTDDTLQTLYQQGVSHAFIALGSNQLRRSLAERIRHIGYASPNILHPSAVISQFASLSEGVYAGPKTVVNASAQVGRHVILNTASTVDHDCTIQDYCHISPGVHLSGGVIVEVGVHIGTGVHSIPGTSIGSWTVIGAGSTIVKDIPANVVAYGVPCQVHRRV